MIKNVFGIILIALSAFLFQRYGHAHDGQPGAIVWGWYLIFGVWGSAGLLMLAIRRLRWAIATMLCVAITMSYLDRNTMGLAVTAIRDSGDVKITDAGFAWINAAFLYAYATMYVVGGKLMDALGTRWGFFWITIFWSLAVMSHGLVGAIGGLIICRLLLGIGEGGGFPAITKAVAEWFPSRERSTAIGLINAGSAFGGMIAPPLAAVILGYHGWPGASHGLNTSWRWVFFFSGSTGIFWCVWWIWLYYPAQRHARLRPIERAELSEVLVAAPDEALAVQAAAKRPGDEDAIRWRDLFKYKVVWALILCKFLGDAVWYFIANWLPKYLVDARGLKVSEMAGAVWMPWAGAGLGCLLVGHLSSFLIHHGRTVNASRKIALGVSVALMPSLFLVPLIESNKWVIVPFVLGYFGQQAWSTIVMTLPTDLFPRRAVGSVAGLVGCGGALGGIVFNLLGGWWLDSHPLKDAVTGAILNTPMHRWGIIYFFAGILHILSFVVILVMIPKIQRVNVLGVPRHA